MKSKKYLFGAIMAAGLCACGETDETANMSSSHQLTEITSLSNKATTRFNGATGQWEELDAIGVYMMDGANSEAINYAGNVPYTLTSGSGTQTATFSSATGITVPEENVNFHAYYPHSTAVSNNVYALDLSNQQGGFKAYDLMYATDSKTADDFAESTALALTFEHKVAKAKITVTLPEGAPAVTGVTINGLNAKADFNIIGGTFSNETAGTITPYTGSAETNTYEAILLPATDITALVLKFETDDGLTYQWSPTGGGNITQFRAGYEYVFNIGLGTNPGTTGAITEIEATGAPFHSAEQQEGTASQATHVPADYTAVKVSAETADLNALLSGASAANVALVFDATQEYATSFGEITVPAAVENLMFVCDHATPTSISMKSFKNGTTLKSLSFHNMNVTGEAGTSLCYELNVTEKISVEKCRFTTMDYVFRVSNGGTLQEVVIDDSQFYNIGNCVITANNCNITTTTLTNSTFSLERGLYSTAGGNAPATCTADHCTLSLGGTAFDFNGSLEGHTWTFTNCVVAANSNYFQNGENTNNSGNITTENNYRTNGNSGGLNNVAALADASELFRADNQADEFYLSSQYATAAGDPRWYANR